MSKPKFEWTISYFEKNHTTIKSWTSKDWTDVEKARKLVDQLLEDHMCADERIEITLKRVK